MSVPEVERRRAQAKPRPGASIQTLATTYLREKRTTGSILKETERKARRVLYTFTDVCPADPAKLTRRDTIRWMKTTTRLAPSSRRLYFTTVKGFTSWLLARGVIRRDPFLGIPTPKVPRPVHRSLTAAQVSALLAACETPRETVIVILGLHTGLRRGEMAALEVGDISLSARTVFVRHGKGGHQRMVPLSAEAAQVIGHYIASTGLREGPFLRNLSRPQQPTTGELVGRCFSQLAYRAGVKVRPWDGVATHATRHTFATDVYEATNDVMAVRDLLGHESLANTQIYVRGMNIERLREAVEGRTYLAQPAGEGPVNYLTATQLDDLADQADAECSPQPLKGCDP